VQGYAGATALPVAPARTISAASALFRVKARTETMPPRQHGHFPCQNRSYPAAHRSNRRCEHDLWALRDQCAPTDANIRAFARKTRSVPPTLWTPPRHPPMLEGVRDE